MTFLISNHRAEREVRKVKKYLITHYINTDTGGRDLIFHTMTYRLDWNESETVTNLKISEKEHDDAKWLSIDEALDLPLVWHARQTMQFVRAKGFEPPNLPLKPSTNLCLPISGLAKVGSVSP